MDREPKVFRYQKPEFEGVKKSTLVCSSDLMRVMVQEVREGGENNLHTHTGEDAFWFVMKGAVKFYGEGDEVLGEFRQNEGFLIPRGFKYWFESSSDEPLQILRVSARDLNVQNKRVDQAPLKQWQAEARGSR
jgi:mannose-6-phosphate isomerase-like protein (cupin superfamily)